MKRGAVIVPTGSGVPAARREANYFQAWGTFKVVKARLRPVRKLRASTGMNIIHFACQVAFDPEQQEQSVIHLEEGGKLSSRDVSDARRNFGRSNPFVFLNACQTGRADFTLVGVGSWAEKMIQSKSSGFMVLLWAIDDELSYQFATYFMTR